MDRSNAPIHCNLKGNPFDENALNIKEMYKK